MTSPSTDRRYGLSPGTAIKAPCRAATTANIALTGEQTIDGIACVTGDRVLVKNQTTTTENGIYVVDTGNWTRDIDADGNYAFVSGTIVIVRVGAANADTSWMVTTASPIIVGTSAITFAAIVPPAVYGSDSALISFLQAGAGAVARTLQSKNRDIVSVFDFMTVAQVADVQAGTLLIDVTAACNAALDASRCVFFPPGNYKISGTGLKFTGTYQHQTVVFGAGSGSTTITYSGAGSAIAEKTGTRTSLRMFGLHIYRTGAYGTTIGIDANAFEDSDLSDLVIEGFASGVEAGTLAGGDCFRVTLRDSVVRSCNYGVRLEGTTTHVLPCNANYILRTFFNTCAESVYMIDGCNNNHVEYCDFETNSASDAIYVNGNDNYLGPNYFEIPAGVKVNIAAGTANRVFGLSHAGGSGGFTDAGTDTIIIDRGTATFPQTFKIPDNLTLYGNANAGKWTTPAYAAGNFTTSGAGGWTVDAGDVVTYEYTIVGKKMTVNFFLTTTSVIAAVGNELRIAIPAAKVATHRLFVPCVISDAGTPGIGIAEVAAAGTYISVYVSGAFGNWTASVNTTQVQGSITFQIN